MESSYTISSIDWDEVVREATNKTLGEEGRARWTAGEARAFLKIATSIDQNIRESYGAASVPANRAIREALDRATVADGYMRIPQDYFENEARPVHQIYSATKLDIQCAAHVLARAQGMSIDQATVQLAYNFILAARLKAYNGIRDRAGERMAESAASLLDEMDRGKVDTLLLGVVAEGPSQIHEAVRTQLRQDIRRLTVTVRQPAQELQPIRRPAGGGLTGPQRDYFADLQYKALQHLGALASDGETAQGGGRSLEPHLAMMKVSTIILLSNECRRQQGTITADHEAMEPKCNEILQTYQDHPDRARLDRAMALARAEVGIRAPGLGGTG